MKKVKIFLPLLIILITLFVIAKSKIDKRVYTLYPFNKALFPPEFPAPTFNWGSYSEYTGTWEISISGMNRKAVFDTILFGTSWIPSEHLWNKLKAQSDRKILRFSVKRFGKPGKSAITFNFSPDSVGAPILYRQMPIPFVLAENLLDSMNFMLLNVGSPKSPHVAMQKFLVCGNCHSFTANGSTIGLDLDAGLRDKGGYFIAPIQDTLYFNMDNYLSWTRIENRRTFGLFSKISPDGRYVVTTVKDRVVSRNFPYDMSTNAFSQLFFPVNGHLAIYDRQS
jgi:hypothetical protein